MTKLTKEKKEQATAALGLPWGRVNLLCDGRRVALLVRSAGGLKYRVFTYVDGVFKGEWVLGSRAFAEQKFLRRSERRLFSASEIEKFGKTLGKPAADNMRAKSIVFFQQDWASGRAAINHLCKVCDSVAIVSLEEANP